ncbi:bacteriohemerythrin [Anaerosinus sp.]|uniref:bacteriohemerythrin n=1 Tax=Selenobaculum sp. TaxID=3074374 RepID=UPI003AB581F0
MMYEFTDDYLTGVEQIDNEHRKLFAIANEAYELLKDNFVSDKYDYIREILEELRGYTKTHFAHEEEYMDEIQYRRRFSQKIQHAEFIKKLEDIDLDRIDENQQETLLEILDFLANWLVSHIKKSDTLINK